MFAHTRRHCTSGLFEVLGFQSSDLGGIFDLQNLVRRKLSNRMHGCLFDQHLHVSARVAFGEVDNVLDVTFLQGMTHFANFRLYDSLPRLLIGKRNVNPPS